MVPIVATKLVSMGKYLRPKHRTNRLVGYRNRHVLWPTLQLVCSILGIGYTLRKLIRCVSEDSQVKKRDESYAVAAPNSSEDFTHVWFPAGFYGIAACINAVSCIFILHVDDAYSFSVSWSRYRKALLRGKMHVSHHVSSVAEFQRAYSMMLQVFVTQVVLFYELIRMVLIWTNISNVCRKEKCTPS